MKQFTVVNFMQLQRKDSLKQRLNISSIYGWISNLNNFAGGFNCP
jgi:hypothetical protein